MNAFDTNILTIDASICKNIDNPNLAISKEALQNFKLIYTNFLEYEQRGILEQIDYIARFRNYYENYEYAKFAV